MKQTITVDIDVRDGYELKYNPETRTIEEVKKEPIRSMSWKEFRKNHPYITKEYYINDAGLIFTVEECNRICCNKLSTKEDAEGIRALIKLIRLHDEWVGDWKPTSEKTYYAISYNLEYEQFVIDAWWRLQQVLSFPTKQMTEEFLNCFKDLIEKAKRFI